MSEPPAEDPMLSYASAPRKTSRLAITSLVLGIPAIPMDIVVLTGMILGLAAIIFGAFSLHYIRKNPSLKGKWIALSGIILGVLSLLIGTTCGYYIFHEPW